MKTIILRIINSVICGCKIIVGLLVIKTGYELTQKQGAFAFWHMESSISGLFVMLIGLAFLLLAVFPQSFGGSD